MPAIWLFVKGLFGNAIAQYVGLGLLALVGAAVVKAQIVAPYNGAIRALKTGSDAKDMIIEADGKQRLEDAKVDDAEKAGLREIIKTLQASSCKPDPSQLERLRKL